MNLLLLLALLLLSSSSHPINSEYIPPGPKYPCPPNPSLIYPCSCDSPSDQGLSLSCNDVSLAVLSTALAYPMGARIPLPTLNIGALNTRQLFGDLFKGINSTRIVLEAPKLFKITPDVFFNVRTTLLELEISRSSLTSFPQEALGSLSLLQKLILDSHEIQELRELKGFGSLKYLQLSNGRISNLAKDTFKTIGGKLSRLDLHGNNLSSIPKEAFAPLKQLEYLDLSHNSFTSLDPTTFFHLSKLTWFNASHNALGEFRRGLFARNPFLRVLHLTHNKIRSLSADTFRGMRLLSRLYLDDNEISEIGRGAFSSLSKIKTLSFPRNRLTLLDFQMFSKLLFLEEIQFGENRLSRISAGAFQELTQVHMNLSHNALSLVEKGSFTSCINITVLDLSHNLLANFTPGAFDQLSYADALNLAHNRLRLTGDIPLKHMEQLRSLNVSFNELREVSKGTFPKLYELHTVDLSWNNLSKIHPAVFGTLFGLRALDLRGNALEGLSGSTLGNIPTLLSLRLDDNRLKSVSSAAFVKLISLRSLSLRNNSLSKVFQIPGSLNELDLSQNNISSLEKVWPLMNSLQRLDLSENQLGGGGISGGSFAGLQALSRINLSSNGITEIPKEALADLTTCQYIDLSNNAVESLERGAFGRLPVLFHLYLSHNRISSIAFKAFDGLIQLLTLDLSHNLLQDSLPGGALATLVSLRSLNLSHNELRRTENGTNSLFEDNLSLELLDLSYNNISQIMMNSFPQHQWTTYRLASLNLSHNSIGIISREIVRGTRTLSTLDLSYNAIAEIRPGLLQNLPLLRNLYLGHNKLFSLPPEAIGPPPALSQLHLEHNRLRKFPLGALRNLTLLNLAFNRLRSYPSAFLDKVKEGGRIEMEGNPLPCACRLAYLQRWYGSLRPALNPNASSFLADYSRFQCELAGGKSAFLQNLDESQLLPCDEEEEEDPLGLEAHLLLPPPPPLQDVELREWRQKGGNRAQLRWRVTSKADLASFTIFLVGEDGAVLQKEMFGYGVRAAGVPLEKGASSICLRGASSEELLEGSSMDKVAGAVCEALDVSMITDAVSGGGVMVEVMVGLVFKVVAGVVLCTFIF